MKKYLSIVFSLVSIFLLAACDSQTETLIETQKESQNPCQNLFDENGRCLDKFCEMTMIGGCDENGFCTDALTCVPKKNPDELTPQPIPQIIPAEPEATDETNKSEIITTGYFSITLPKNWNATYISDFMFEMMFDENGNAFTDLPEHGTAYSFYAEEESNYMFVIGQISVKDKGNRHIPSYMKFIVEDKNYAYYAGIWPEEFIEQIGEKRSEKAKELLKDYDNIISTFKINTPPPDYSQTDNP